MKSTLFQYVILATALTLVACGDNSDTASKMDSPNTPPGSSKPNKPSNRPFASDGLAALMNIGLFNIERSLEVALKDAKATRIERGENDRATCQKVESSVSGQVKNVTLTTQGRCAKTRSRGQETFQLTTEGGNARKLVTQSSYYSFTSSAPAHDYIIQQDTYLTPAANSASPLASDFTHTTNVNVSIRDTRDSSRPATFTITIRGTAVFAKATGLMTAVSIELAKVTIHRQDKSGSRSTLSTISLSPTDSEFAALSCGRYAGRMNFHQTVSTSDGRVNNGLNGSLLFTPDSVTSTEDEALRTSVADCAVGLATIESDLMNAGNKVIRTLLATNARTQVEESTPADEE